MSTDSPDAKTPEAPAPAGYRTLVPRQGPTSATTPAAKAPGKPTAAPSQPAPAKPADKTGAETAHDDPTRYGDWEVKGRCIDF